jgi:Spy/CpxP family protein refolding chaperone
MIGFLIGTACLLGAFKVLFGHRRRGFACGYGGHGYGACGGYGAYGGFGPPGPGGGWDAEGGRRGPFGRGFRGGLRGLLFWLDLSPEQEKPVTEALEEVEKAMHATRDEVHAVRERLAKAMAEEQFDETTYGELLAKLDAAYEATRGAMLNALSKLHATLDPSQRRRLAAVLSRGPRAIFESFGGAHGPYRRGY